MSKITAILIITSLILTISVPVFALTEGPAELLIQTPGGEQTTTAQILPETLNYTLRFVNRSKKFEEITKREALLYAYIPADRLGKTVFVAIEIGSSRSTWHLWEASLITWPQLHGLPPRVTQLDLRDVQLLQNPPIIGRFFAFQWLNSSTNQVVLYWCEKALFNTGSSSEQKYVKISVIARTKNPEEVPEIENLILPFGEAIVKYWQPLKTWSQIALFISQNGIILITVTVASLAIILSYYVMREEGERKSNLIFYNKLALKEEKLILQATRQAAQKEKPTTNAIASHYQKLTGTPIELEPLIEKLNEAEKAGLIKKEIASKEDEPILTWKNKIPA